MKLVNKPNMRVTRNGQVAVIVKELLEFCLVEVGKIQYNFHDLEECVVSSALDKRFLVLIW